MMTWMEGHRWIAEIVFAAAFVGLALAVLADQLQLLAKYRGARKQRVAGGYNVAMKVMVANRVGATLYFLILAYHVDLGVSPDVLVRALAVTITLLMVPAAGLWLWWRGQQRARGVRSPGPMASFRPLGIVVVTFFTTTLNLLGLTLPWIAGAMFPELRLTLANTSFLFNTTATVIGVFYIEHKFAQLIDRDDHEIHEFVGGVTVARFLSYGVIGGGLWLGYWL